MNKSLIFIDTNIFLDFYRTRGLAGDLAILRRMDANLGRFITTSQVEMEFKKNRSNEIVKLYDSLKLDWSGLQLPACLTGSNEHKALERNKKEIKRHAAKLKARVTRMLEQPAKYDAVYKTAQRLFRSRSEWSLGRDKKVLLAIRTLARERFALGQPPRKPDDTSYGDAINWEWILHCAGRCTDDMVIVTRDSDYGVALGNDEPLLNDWLRQEFSERFGRNRRVVLTRKLSSALKAASITVTNKEIESEEELLKQRDADVGGALTWLPGVNVRDMTQYQDYPAGARAAYAHYLYGQSFPYGQTPLVLRVAAQAANPPEQPDNPPKDNAS